MHRHLKCLLCARFYSRHYGLRGQNRQVPSQGGLSRSLYFNEGGIIKNRNINNLMSDGDENYS